MVCIVCVWSGVRYYVFVCVLPGFSAAPLPAWHVMLMACVARTPSNWNSSPHTHAPVAAFSTVDELRRLL